MHILDKEIVESNPNNSQVERSEIKPYNKIVSGSTVGKKWKEVLMGGLTAADLCYFSYWETIGENDDDRAKSFKGDAIQLMRWMATVGTADWSDWRANGSKGKPKLKDTPETAFYILMINELANIGFWELSDHPELQFKLIASAGTGHKNEHQWLDMPKSRRKLNKIDELLMTKYPSANSIELNMLKQQLVESDIISIAKDNAFDDKTIKGLLKEFKVMVK